MVDTLNLLLCWCLPIEQMVLHVQAMKSSLHQCWPQSIWHFQQLVSLFNMEHITSFCSNFKQFQFNLGWNFPFTCSWILLWTDTLHKLFRMEAKIFKSYFPQSFYKWQCLHFIRLCLFIWANFNSILDEFFLFTWSISCKS